MAVISLTWGFKLYPLRMVTGGLFNLTPGSLFLHELCCSYSCLQLSYSYARAWPRAPLIWTMAHGLTSWLARGPTLSPWTFLVTTGLCLTLATATGPNPVL